MPLTVSYYLSYHGFQFKTSRLPFQVKWIILHGCCNLRSFVRNPASPSASSFGTRSPT